MARPGLMTHPKFRRLVHVLGVPVPHALGYLECMWSVCYERGDPLLGDALDVELAAQWPGDKGKLFEAMRECRFIDQVDQDRFEVHDLFDHAPDYVRKRMEREHTRKRAYGSRNRPLTAALRPEADKASQNDQLGGHCPPNGDDSRTLLDLGLPPPPPPPPNSSAGAEVSAKPTSATPLTFEEFQTSWNATGCFSKCEKLTEKRKRAFRARLKDTSWLTSWRKALAKIASSPFCRGETGGTWRANVDWFLKPDTVTTILEGKYDDKTRSTAGGDGASSEDGAAYAARMQAEREERSRRLARAQHAPSIKDIEIDVGSPASMNHD